MDWPIVLDDASIGALVAHLGSRRGRVQLLRGPSGIGKSTQAAAVAARMERAGHTILSIVAMPELRDVPLGAMAPLLAATGAPVDEPTDKRLQRLFSLVSATRGKHVLVVDDGPMLDDISASTVYQLIRVYRIPCIMTVRTEHELSGPLLRLQDEGLIDVVDQAGLSAKAAGALVRRALGARIEPSSLRTLVERAGGNPLFLRELLLAAKRSGVIHEGRGGIVIDSASLPERLRDSIAGRFRALDPDARALAELIAVAEPWPEALLPHPDLLGTLDAAGLIARAADGEVYLAHPLFAETLLSVLSEVERDARRIEGAELLRNGTRTDHRFTSICLLAETPTPPSAAELAWAARYAHGLADHLLAIRLSTAAVERAAHDDEVVPSDALLVRADALSAVGRLDEADEAFADAADAAESEDVLAAVTVRRCYHIAMRRQRPVEAVALGMRVLDTLPPSRGQVLLASNITNWRLMAGDPAVHSRQHIVDDADAAAVLDAELYRLTAAIFAGDLISARSAIAAARTKTATVGIMKRNSGPILDFGTFLVESLDGHIRESIAFAQRQRGDGFAEAVGMWNYGISLVTLHAGRTQEAFELAGQAVEQLTWRDFLGAAGAAVAVHATAAARLGRNDEADAILARLNPEARDFAATRLQIAEVQAWRLLHEGDEAGAVDHIRLAVDRGIEAKYFSFSGLTAAVAVLFGHPEAVVEQLRTITASTSSALMGILLAHAEAAVAEDADALIEAAERLATAGLPAGAAAAARQAAGLARAAGRHRLARRASLLTSEWSRNLSGRDPARHDDSAFTLSAREWTVATAAAGRERSKEIAARLGVSARTVDNHLANIYRKLGVSGRDALRQELESLQAEGWSAPNDPASA